MLVFESSPSEGMNLLSRALLLSIKLQEISLQYVDNAVNFLHKQRSDSISNISDMTETLLKGTALVVGMASEDAKYSSNSPDETRGTGKAKVKSDLQ